MLLHVINFNLHWIVIKLQMRKKVVLEGMTLKEGGDILDLNDPGH